MRRTALAGLAAIVALSVSACSVIGGGDEPSVAPTSPPASAPASAPATAPANPTGSTSSSPSAGAPTPADPDQSGGNEDLGQVVATRKSTIDGSAVQLKFYPVVRAGTTSHINLVIESLEEDKKAQIAQVFSDDNGKAGDAGAFAADGLELVDGKNAKLYLVASDGRGQCVCSRRLAGVFATKGQPVIISATFAAPPADVTTVDVSVPSFGTVKNVPVQ